MEIIVGEKRNDDGRSRKARLEERLLLFALRQPAFQIVHALPQTLVIQTQEIETIQQLFALNVRPCQRALQSGQFELGLTSFVEP